MPAGWMPLADDSVALVVTSPPYFAGKQYEEELDREGVPGSYLEYLALLRDVFAECKRVLEPGGRIAVNVANLGRKPYRSLAADVMSHPAGRPAPAPPGRDRLAEGRGGQRLVRLGLVPLRRQPGAARRDRAGRRRQQGALRPGPHSQGAPSRRAAPREQHRRRRLHGAHARRVGHPARERGAGPAPGSLPRGAARSA